MTLQAQGDWANDICSGAGSLEKAAVPQAQCSPAKGSPGHGITNLVDLLRYRARCQPDEIAYTFITDPDFSEAAYTYGRFERKVRAIAAALQSLGGTQERALIAVPQSPEYIAAFFGCLFAGTIAVSAYPPISKLHVNRLRGMAADSQARFLITTTKIYETIVSQAYSCPEVASLVPINLDTIDERTAGDWDPPEITARTIAFLQYTSGSTSAPKGVVVTHGNIFANERMIQSAFGHDGSTIVVGWLPLFHDMGLLGNILQPMYLGVPSIFMTPTMFIRRPVNWLRAITHYRATTSGAPNFAYQMCADQITEEEKAGLDLSSWKVAYCGAEPIHADTVTRFTEAFANCGFRPEAFYPCYGMAEATLLITGGDHRVAPVLYPVNAAALESNAAVPSVAPSNPRSTRVLVGCGKPQRGERVEIVDPASRKRCSTGRVGEIWVSGPNVTAGYWNRADQTQDAFHARISNTDEGPFLRTGDLGFLRPDGELFVVGRLKDLIIIRGRNHAPQDIERTVEKCDPAIRATGVAAFSVEKGSEERLVVVAEVKRDSLPNLDPGRVEKNIRREISLRHELDVLEVVLVQNGTVHKTTSGKLQRQESKRSYLAGTLNRLSPANGSEIAHG